MNHHLDGEKRLGQNEHLRRRNGTSPEAENRTMNQGPQRLITSLINPETDRRR